MFYENRMEVELEHLPVNVYTNYNFSFLAHWHPETELAWVTAGSAGIGINHQMHTLYPGDLCLIRSGEIHYYESLDPDLCIVVMVCPTDLVEEFAEWSRQYKIREAVLTKDEVQKLGLSSCYEAIEQLKSEQTVRDKAFRSYMKVVASRVLMDIMRKWPSIEVSSEVIRQKNAGLHHIKEILLYLDANMTQELTLETLSNVFHLDPYYLSKLFNKTTGMHFKTYLNEKRILLAKEKLLEKKYTGDIAWECGFNSVRNFNRVFKSLVGVTPGEYKQNEKKMEEL